MYIQIIKFDSWVAYDIIDIYNTTSKHLYRKFSSVKLKVSNILCF